GPRTCRAWSRHGRTCRSPASRCPRRTWGARTRSTRSCRCPRASRSPPWPSATPEPATQRGSPPGSWASPIRESRLAPSRKGRRWPIARAEMPRVRLPDTTFRDVNRLNGLQVDDLATLAGKLDPLGFFSLDAFGGRSFDALLRRGLDPWEWLRRLAEATPG